MVIWPVLRSRRVVRLAFFELLGAGCIDTAVLTAHEVKEMSELVIAWRIPIRSASEAWTYACTLIGWDISRSYGMSVGIDALCPILKQRELFRSKAK